MLQQQKLLLDVAAELNDNCSVADKIAHELDYLIEQPYFNQFDCNINFDTLNFSHAVKIIEKTAPTWHTMLLQLISNQHAHWSSYIANTELLIIMLSKHLFVITSMICHSQAK